MTINNKLLLSIIAFSLSITFAGTIGLFIPNPSLTYLINIGLALFIVSGTYLLGKNGTFMNSSECRMSRLGISILLIGILCKIMHWPFTAPILTLACMCFPIMYLYYIIKNHRFRWSDIFKLLFISFIVLSIYLKIFHMPYSQESKFIGITILLILVIDLIKTKKILI